MKKILRMLSAGLIIALAGIALAYADEGQTPATDVVNNPPAASAAPPPADASKCTMKTDLSADMVAKCTEAMANGSQAMLAGCCQEGG